MLIEIDGVRILTDPVWGPRASPSALVGPKRFQPVPVTLREMPPVDVVVISHESLRSPRLPDHPCARQNPRALRTSLGVGAQSRILGYPAGAHHRARLVGIVARAHSDVVLTAAPSQHFSGRGLQGSQCDAVVVDCGPLTEARRVLQRRYGSDDGVSIDPREARPFDVVMLKLAPFTPVGAIFTSDPSMPSRRAPVGRLFMPVHWGTFALAMHAWDQPAERLLELAPRSGAQLLMPQLGQPVETRHTARGRPRGSWGGCGRVESSGVRVRPFRTDGAVTLPSSVQWPLD